MLPFLSFRSLHVIILIDEIDMFKLNICGLQQEGRLRFNQSMTIALNGTHISSIHFWDDHVSDNHQVADSAYCLSMVP